MDATALAYEKLIGNFTQWADGNDDIRAALVLGSRARTADHPADEWADLDMTVITSSPDRLLNDVDWVSAVGVPVLHIIETTASGQDKEVRVLFEGGLDVDFAIVPYDKAQWIINNPLPPELAREIKNSLGRGLRALIDKEGLAGQLQNVLDHLPASPAPLPGEGEFSHNVNDFWYHALWTAKHLRRGELWWAKSGCDWRMKYLLGQMLEWHARAAHDDSRDTWFRGRFLEQWAEPRALEDLRNAFAHYDAPDIWRALLATMDVYRRLAVDTAEKWGYAYPKAGDAYVTRLVVSLSAGGSLV